MMELVCPACNEKTKPLAFGAYCPNDCDKKSESASVGGRSGWAHPWWPLTDMKGRPWVMMLLPDRRESTVPKQATSSWVLSNSDSLADSKIPIDELVRRWEKEAKSADLLGIGYVQSLEDTNTMATRNKMLVFWLV